MSSTPTRNNALTSVLADYIRAPVVSGHSSNASAVGRAGLRLLIERDGTGARTALKGNAHKTR